MISKPKQIYIDTSAEQEIETHNSQCTLSIIFCRRNLIVLSLFTTFIAVSNISSHRVLNSIDDAGIKYANITIESDENATAEHTTPMKKLIDDYTCRGEWSEINQKYYYDRIQNGAKLYLGEFICSENDVYLLGLDTNGDFIAVDTSKKEEKQKVVYFNSGKDKDEIEADKYYFMLQSNGEFSIFDDSGLGEDKTNNVWSMECNDRYGDVGYTEKCLWDHEIYYDCPYLHIHNDGVTVLNFINVDYGWNARDIVKLYDFE